MQHATLIHGLRQRTYRTTPAADGNKHESVSLYQCIRLISCEDSLTMLSATDQNVIGEPFSGKATAESTPNNVTQTIAIYEISTKARSQIKCFPVFQFFSIII